MTAAIAETIEVEYWADTAQRLHRLAQEPGFVFLDSCRFSGATGRFDIVAWAPQTTVRTRGEVSEVSTGDGETYTTSQDPFELIRQLVGTEERHPFLPFTGGAIGAFSYDLGRRIERLPNLAASDIDFPDLWVGIFDRALIVDHVSARAWLVHRNIAEPEIRRLLQILEVPRTVTPPAFARDFVVTSAVESAISFGEYAEQFDKIKNYIRAGDCYQVNYSQRFSASVSGDPWHAYLHLRLLNSAPFAAFVRIEEGAILSSSPERFLEVRGDVVESKPIKGTRPRSPNSDRDQRLAEELRDSAKDRAENLMIVDLLRNDIGRSCEIGSVNVPHLFEVESFARVHHLVSTVHGKLGDSVDALAVLRSCFPGGSITGAPKIRAMEIIEELEPTRRTIYCGSIAYISHDGQMDSSIAIRTLLNVNQRLYCWAGGGIVADSNLHDEYQESLDKAAAMLNLFSDTQIEHVGH